MEGVEIKRFIPACDCALLREQWNTYSAAALLLERCSGAYMHPVTFHADACTAVSVGCRSTTAASSGNQTYTRRQRQTTTTTHTTSSLPPGVYRISYRLLLFFIGLTSHTGRQTAAMRSCLRALVRCPPLVVGVRRSNHLQRRR